MNINIYYRHDWSALADLSVADMGSDEDKYLADDREETLDCCVAIDRAATTAIDIWNYCGCDIATETHLLTFAIRKYMALCEHLSIDPADLDADSIYYSLDDLDRAEQADYDMLCDYLDMVLPLTVAQDQRTALRKR